MENLEMVKSLEAVLFAGGEPISKSKLAQIFEITEKQVEKLADKAIEHISAADLGFTIVKLDDSYQIISKKEYAECIKKALEIKRRTPLSAAALEVLAVVAYNQPVTKSFIEQVRGVDCSGVISTLLEKNLIEESGRLELPGRPLLYSTTKNFLRCFSLSSLDELPELPDKNIKSAEFAEQLEVISDI